MDSQIHILRDEFARQLEHLAQELRLGQHSCLAVISVKDGNWNLQSMGFSSPAEVLGTLAGAGIKLFMDKQKGG